MSNRPSRRRPWSSSQARSKRTGDWSNSCDKHAIAVDCGSFGTTAEAAKWVKMRLEKDGLSIEPQAISVLLDAVSHDAGRIRAEVEKLALFAAGDRNVTVQHVRDLISPELRPGDWFVLRDALGARNARAALREVDAQCEAGFKEVQILGLIRSVVRGMPDERAKRGLDAVFRTDLALKTGGDPRAPRYLLETSRRGTVWEVAGVKQGTDAENVFVASCPLWLRYC